jgi:rubrerythrin
LRDTLEMQSAAARFFGEIARQASVPESRKLLLDLARIEQLLSLEIDTMAAQLVEAPLPSRFSTKIAGTKTAPEWTHVRLITHEQCLAVALDCTRRASHFFVDLAAHLDGPALHFFLTLAQSHEDRALMLEASLDLKLRELAARHAVKRILAATLGAVRRAGSAYGWLVRRTSRARTREFLRGMQEVCGLQAAGIQGLLGDAAIEAEDPVLECLATATLPILDGPVEDLDFEAALRAAMHAQKRAALVHEMLARPFAGDAAQRLLQLAGAERRHAATVAAVLDRLHAGSDQGDLPFAPTSEDAPCYSFRCLPIETQVAQEDLVPPSLRLVVG